MSWVSVKPYFAKIKGREYKVIAEDSLDSDRLLAINNLDEEVVIYRDEIDNYLEKFQKKRKSWRKKLGMLVKESLEKLNEKDKKIAEEIINKLRMREDEIKRVAISDIPLSLIQQIVKSIVPSAKIIRRYRSTVPINDTEITFELTKTMHLFVSISDYRYDVSLYGNIIEIGFSFYPASSQTFGHYDYTIDIPYRMTR